MIREFLAVAARSALQWALASLLLANGAAFCLIAAAAARLRLGPPCILCARVHRLLCSSDASGGGGGGRERDALRHLLCGAHLAAVDSEKEARRACDRGGDVDGVPESRDGMEADDQHKDSGLETHRVVSISSEICEQDHADEPPRAAGRSDATRTAADDDGNGPLVSLFELAPIAAHPPRNSNDDAVDSSLDRAALEDLLTGDGNAVARLAAALRELDTVRAQLAAERRARAEAEEHQRQLEEQGELDREAARLAMQLVHEAEAAKHGLQRQLEACRVRAQLYDGGAQDAGGEGGGSWEANGGGGGNYQSLVDFLPGSVYSSSPDLANLLKLYTEAGNGDRRQRDGYASAVAVITEEAEEEVAMTVTAGPESVDSTTAIVGHSLHEQSINCHVENSNRSRLIRHTRAFIR